MDNFRQAIEAEENRLYLELLKAKTDLLNTQSRWLELRQTTFVSLPWAVADRLLKKIDENL